MYYGAKGQQFVASTNKFALEAWDPGHTVVGVEVVELGVVQAVHGNALEGGQMSR